VPDCEPADFTVATVPARFAKLGDPHAEIDAVAGSLEGLLELAARDEASGLGDAPWPPHYRKMEGEGARVAPSRKKGAAKKAPRVKMPLLTIANSPSKQAALDGLERWKARHPQVAEKLAADDVLVDAMRGRSSTWTRIRVNLKNVPEELRPSQETPDPDDDPTREWRAKWKKAKDAGDSD
jgi:bifunctional non-homologous end joining protein LigD